MNSQVLKGETPGAARLWSTLAIVVRATGERTAAGCRELLARELAAAPTTIVGGRPFPETLADSMRAGIRAGCQWTLCVDADVLPLSGAVAALLAEAEKMPSSFVEIQPLVFDRFFGGWRPAGVHLYRTLHLPRALAVLSGMATSIRPETALLLRLAEEGLGWRQSAVEFGLHDFGQWPRDVYRKCFVHARKHAELRPAFERYWRTRAAEPDFAVALHGLATGTAHAGTIELDAAAPYLQPGGDEGDALGELTGLPDVAAVLEAEEIAVRRFDSVAAPVWDWIESSWAGEANRGVTIDAFVRLLLESGSGPCVVERTDSRTRVFLRMAADWGLPVAGVVTVGPTPYRRCRDVPVVTDTQARAAGLVRIERTADGRLMARVRDVELIEPVPGSFPGGRARRPRSEEVAELVCRIRRLGTDRVLVYGAGQIGAEVAVAAGKDLTIVAYIESEPESRRAGPSMAPVLTPEEALSRFRNMDVVIASLASARAMGRRWMAAAAKTGNVSGRIWLLESA